MRDEPRRGMLPWWKWYPTGPRFWVAAAVAWIVGAILLGLFVFDGPKVMAAAVGIPALVGVEWLFGGLTPEQRRRTSRTSYRRLGLDVEPRIDELDEIASRQREQEEAEARKQRRSTERPLSVATQGVAPGYSRKRRRKQRSHHR